MKTFISCIILLLLAACTQPGADTARLQSKIDSLQQKLATRYKPGLGEFMSGIQVHHAKLWFAGTAGNWNLSDFETKEIRESLDDIESFCADRPEVKSLPMIKPALDSVDEAIKSKSSSRFKTSFMLLTNTCNSCHQATHHEFNVIQVPLTPPFTNQRFEKQAP
jgi:hypothetical protein